MAQSFTRSTAARKGLYLRDVSLRPKTDPTRVRLLVLFHALKTTGTNGTSNFKWWGSHWNRTATCIRRCFYTAFRETDANYPSVSSTKLPWKNLYPRDNEAFIGRFSRAKFSINEPVMTGTYARLVCQHLLPVKADDAVAMFVSCHASPRFHAKSTYVTSYLAAAWQEWIQHERCLTLRRCKFQPSRFTKTCCFG